MDIVANLHAILNQLPESVQLVAVSKTKPHEMILELYGAGQRVFGENKVQDMTSKWESLPNDIEWHMIGHLQANKVKYIAPYVALIHGVDSIKLAHEISKRAIQNNRIISILLQVNISNEDQKHGFLPNDLNEAVNEIEQLEGLKIKGLMGMATHTEDERIISQEFELLKNSYDLFKVDLNWSVLSMGMSHDFKLAIAKGATHVRIGSSIFGARSYA